MPPQLPGSVGVFAVVVSERNRASEPFILARVFRGLKKTFPGFDAKLSGAGLLQPMAELRINDAMSEQSVTSKTLQPNPMLGQLEDIKRAVV